MEPLFWKTAGLLVLSNTFMTLAWYGHLRFKEAPLWIAIFASWIIALPEYALQVPANRLGYEKLSGYELKILQECITLLVFMVFAFFALKESPSWRHLVAFALILSAVAVTYTGK
jgi:uncharacterized protein (DUF486 family)